MRRARFLVLMEKPEEARVIYEKVDRLAPENLSRLENMAALYLNLKEPEEAIGKFS